MCFVYLKMHALKNVVLQLHLVVPSISLHYFVRQAAHMDFIMNNHVYLKYFVAIMNEGKFLLCIQRKVMKKYVTYFF